MEFDQDSAHTPQPALDSIANYVAISSFRKNAGLPRRDFVVSLRLFPMPEILVSLSHVQVE